MTIKQHGIILGAFAISLLGAPIRAEKSVVAPTQTPAQTQTNKLASGAQLATAIAILPAVVAANWADLNKDLKGTKKATALKVLADAVRAANAISSLYDFNNSFYSNKYKIVLAAWDSEQLVVDLWELFGSPKITAPSTPADSATTLTEAQLDKHLSTLSYSLRVVVLPLVEMGAAVWTASTPNPSDPKSLKWDACVHSLRSLSRLTSDYLVVKKASVQEKLYLAGILCNVYLLAYDFFTIEKRAVKKEEPKEEFKKENDFEAKQEEIKKQQKLDKKEEPKKQFKKENDFKAKQEELKKQEELRKQDFLDDTKDLDKEDASELDKEVSELKKEKEQALKKERQARLKVMYDKQEADKEEKRKEDALANLDESHKDMGKLVKNEEVPAPTITTPITVVSNTNPQQPEIPVNEKPTSEKNNTQK